MLDGISHKGSEKDSSSMAALVTGNSVAAGTATYCSSRSNFSGRSFSQHTSRSRENEMDVGGGGEDDTAQEKWVFPSIREKGERQRNLYRRLIFHMGVVPLLLFLSLSAQQCSSEVIRLRHPDHLFYGDRGGGGSGSHSHINRRLNINSMNMDNEDFSLEQVSPEAAALLAIKEEGFQSSSQSYHHKSHNSAISSQYKRKSQDSNNNIDSNVISSSKRDSSDDVGTNDNDDERASNYNDDDHVSSSRFQRGHQWQQQQQRFDDVKNNNTNYVAMEDRELPVYFARQGNDGNQEVDQFDPAPAPAGSSEAPLEEKEAEGKLFPPDIFTLEQRRQGAVVFYIIGVIYMFVALAIVCDEFFVPSLDVIIEFLAIQDDVAGATFMAAGGSAPELFTSVIGVFISKDDVGIGTIVGSAVFNILFVIGMCALFSKTVLRLTWWPLFRDCSFYSIALITLIIFFRDSHIYWWEALILFSIYCFYVTFMKFNQPFEKALKKLLFKNRVTRVSSTDQLVNNKSVNNGASSSQTSVQTVSGNQSSRGSATMKPPLSASGRRNSIPMLHSGSKFRHGLLQLMIQSIDPLHDGRVDEKATQLHAIASLKALLDAAKTEADATVTNNSRSKPVSPPQVPPSVQPSDAPLTTVDIEDQANGDAPTVQELAALQEAAEEGHEPLDISWPKGDCKKQISYILLFPIMISLYLTLPDTRTPRGKKFFAWGFLGSILWIAIFSYFMVWWADKTGETFGIAPEIMGLTFLAAGTSIPDLITSVIVARKGLGDMAVSSSVGSNIFDVCVGLPIPWLLYGIFKGEPVEVSAKGMLCSISILFGMLCFVVLSIMLFRWKMNKGLGLVMFVLYFIFLGVSLLFEYNVITCPRFFEP